MDQYFELGERIVDIREATSGAEKDHRQVVDRIARRRARL